MPDAPRFATQIVGSWCKPHWLADHDNVYGKEGTWWRVPPEFRAEALDDAVRLAVFDQNRAGLTYQTDGECRRQTFSGHFYAFGGIDSDEQGAVTNFSNDVGEYLTMKQRAAAVVAEAVVSEDSAEPPLPPPSPPKFEQPRVVGPLTWERSILAADARFLSRYAAGLSKMTVIGPVTLALRLVDEHYGSLAQMTLALADVINAELKAVEACGIDLIQIDEPEVHFRYSQVADFAAEAIDRALHGITARTGVHMCYGYSKNIAEKRATPVYEQALSILAATTVDEISIEYEQPQHQPDLLTHAGDKCVTLGLLDLDTEAAVETVDHILERASDALEVLGPDQLRLGPDCGMWFLPRDHAFAKIANLEGAARVLRERHG